MLWILIKQGRFHEIHSLINTNTVSGIISVCDPRIFLKPNFAVQEAKGAWCVIPAICIVHTKAYQHPLSFDFFLPPIEDEWCQGSIGSHKTYEQFRDVKGCTKESRKSSNTRTDITKPNLNQVAHYFVLCVCYYTSMGLPKVCSLLAYYRVVVVR